jgi:hypothetical protein
LTIVFSLAAVAAAVLAVGGIVGPSWKGGKFLFFAFFVLAVVAFLGHGYQKQDAYDE